MLFIDNFFVEFMVSEIPRMSVFGYCPYSVTFLNIVIINLDVLIFLFLDLQIYR